MTTEDDRLARLQAERERAAAELSAAETALRSFRRLRTDTDDDEHDPDGAPLSAEWSRLETRRQVARDHVAELDAALLDARRGSYGRCTVCGAVIPAGRLEARPGTRTCVRCADRRR